MIKAEALRRAREVLRPGSVFLALGERRTARDEAADPKMGYLSQYVKVRARAFTKPLSCSQAREIAVCITSTVFTMKKPHNRNIIC
jgi:hypothetical protein